MADKINHAAEAQQHIDWAHDHMAAYKVPRVVEFVDELPKSGTGKVMWRQLQERQDASDGSADGAADS